MPKSSWTVTFTDQAVKQLKKLDKKAQVQIRNYIRTKVLASKDPTSLGKPLVGSKKGIWRYRTGNYRILCHINAQEVKILVLNVGHRKDIYKR